MNKMTLPLPESASNAFAVADYSFSSSQESLTALVASDQGVDSIEPVLSEILSPKECDLKDIYGTLNPVIHTWGSPGFRPFLENLHGKRYGSHVGSYVVAGMIFLAAHQHRASRAILSTNICINGDMENSTTIALWDNGNQYPNFRSMFDSFSEDKVLNLLTNRPGHGLHTEEGAALPAVLSHATAKKFGGVLSVLSGSVRMDISATSSKYIFTYTSIPSVDGNLVMARLPHVKTAKY